MSVVLANIDPVWMLLAGCALLALILLRRSHRYFAKPRPRRGWEPPIEQQPRPKSQWDGVCNDAAARIERQKVELHEFARDASGRMNSKMIMLEQLIHTSERQIRRLETLLLEVEQKQSSRDGATAERLGEPGQSLGR